jgi:enoyl-CoA hydratase/carnithine racemase
MIAALHAELDRAATNDVARVVVLRAEGRGFSAGHDLKEMRGKVGDDAWQRQLFDDCSRMMMAITTLPKPVIARVHGIATAAGCQLVAMCDLAVAADTATFALPGVNVGIFCSTPAVAVARNIGRKPVMEMLLTGQPVDARAALQWGLVNRVVPLAELDSEIEKLTSVIAARSPATIAVGKQTFYRQIERGLEPAYDVASEAMTCNMSFHDAAEGIDAFLGKRSASWEGR